jgi:hypothetical protein
MIKAIARALRWQKMLETCRYATIKEIAKAEKINPSYVSRILRLTLLAPALVEALVHGRQNSAMSLHKFDEAIPSRVEATGRIVRGRPSQKDAVAFWIYAAEMHTFHRQLQEPQLASCNVTVMVISPCRSGTSVSNSKRSTTS